MEPGAIAVTGANGFIARNLRRLLSDRDIPVVAVARRDFEPHGNEVRVVAPDYDPGLMLPRVRRCACMVHLVGAGRQGAGSAYSSANAGITGRMADLCRAAGIGRIVYCSGLGVAENSATDYFISKLLAERRITRSGLDYTIFRPSYVIGEDDLLTRNIRGQIAAGLVTIPGSGRFPIQPVHVGDACRAILGSCAGGGFSRRVIDMVGPRAVTFEWFVRGMVAGRAPVRRVSMEDAYREAVRNTGFPYGVDDLNILAGCFEGDHGEIRRLAGFDFMAPEEMLESGVPP